MGFEFSYYIKTTYSLLLIALCRFVLPGDPYPPDGPISACSAENSVSVSLRKLKEGQEDKSGRFNIHYGEQQMTIVIPLSFFLNSLSVFD
jgi:hypothetical protein